MSTAIDKVIEGFSDLDKEIEDFDTRCAILESKFIQLQNEKEKFLTDLSHLIEQYNKKIY